MSKNKPSLPGDKVRDIQISRETPSQRVERTRDFFRTIAAELNAAGEQVDIPTLAERSGLGYQFTYQFFFRDQDLKQELNVVVKKILKKGEKPQEPEIGEGPVSSDALITLMEEEIERAAALIVRTGNIPTPEKILSLLGGRINGRLVKQWMVESFLRQRVALVRKYNILLPTVAPVPLRATSRR